MQRLPLRLAVVALALIAGAIACRRADPPIPPPTGNRVVLIGLDAATWTIMRPLVDAGQMPNVKALIDRGWSGTLLSKEPTFSPIIWTTIASGRKAKDHGIFGFLAPTADGQEVPVTSNLRRAETLWTIASRTGRSVNVIGWYVSWPVEPINGIMVADRFGPQREATPIAGGMNSLTKEYPGVYPPSFNDTAMSLIVYPEDFLSPSEEKVHAQFRIYPVDATRTAIAEEVLTNHPADLTMIYLWGIDPTQHLFWKFHDPKSWVGPPMDPNDVFLHGDPVVDYYKDTDVFLGRILSHLRDTDTVMIVSDHGAGPATEYDPKHKNSGSHRLEGIIIAAGPPIRHGVAAEPPSVFDVAPTVLHLLGLPPSRQMPGNVIDAMFTPEWAHSHPEQRIATWEPADRKIDRYPIATKNDENIKSKLRTLGYIQ